MEPTNNKSPKGFNKAKRKAEQILKSTDRVQRLLKKAEAKSRTRKNALEYVWDDLQTLMRLIKSYVSGSYQDLSAATILYAVAGLVYFVNPFDLIPDFILGFGFIDDAAVLAYVLSRIKKEIDLFKNWEG